MLEVIGGPVLAVTPFGTGPAFLVQVYNENSYKCHCFE